MKAEETKEKRAGGMKKKREMDPAFFIGAAILHLADTLKTTMPLLAMSTSVELESDSIPLQCGGRYDAFAIGTGEETERDFPGGDGPAAVRSEAARKAREEAEEAALEELEKIENRIVCDEGCSVQAVGEPKITFSRVVFDKDDFGYFVSWDASVTATAKQTFKCVKD